jgi:methylated-DNA-[protein]-cysteine S-methyltransferase
MIYTTFDGPIGELLICGDGETVHGLYMQHGRKPFRPRATWVRDDDAFTDAREQLREYFAGERRDFDVPVALNGSDYQLRVWNALREIPYGETTSYGALAKKIGDPAGARAVGWANGSNRIAIIVPCHRVIGANGSLTGYAGGLDNKRLLLDLEAGLVPLTLE